MKKRFFSIVLSILCFSSTDANAQQQLVVWQKNGQKVHFDLTEEPHTNFENGKLVITTSSMRTEYKLGSIIRYTYEGASTNISSSKHEGVSFAHKGDNISIRGLKNKENVYLYSPNGILLENSIANDEYSAHFSLANRPQGVYIVKFRDQSLKFFKQ